MLDVEFTTYNSHSFINNGLAAVISVGLSLTRSSITLSISPLIFASFLPKLSRHFWRSCCFRLDLDWVIASPWENNFENKDCHCADGLLGATNNETWPTNIEMTLNKTRMKPNFFIATNDAVWRSCVPTNSLLREGCWMLDVGREGERGESTGTYYLLWGRYLN